MNIALESLFSLTGKTALVSGASRGIGHSIAETLSAAGAKVVAFARSDKPNHPFKENVDYSPCDITDIESVGRICDRMVADLKCIDILVNCAGISLEPDRNGNTTNFQQTIDVNLTATFNLISAVVRFMKKNNRGSIINITSLASNFGMPDNPGYVASKGGLSMLTKALAIDFAQDNIRVNNIVPGYILTGLTRRSHSDKKLKKQRDERIIKNRWGTPEDLAGAVILLASDASDYITGTDIVVDGGWSAKGL
jgi:NAD(P)-dependent dehydrogenase (short-subunit alcohol dehydrogenase family)